MAKQSKSKAASVDQPSNEASPPFETALSDLQQIVEDLEDNSLGLEASLAQFEKGIGLLRQCHQILEQAEQKIEILMNFKADGEAVTVPFDAAPTANQPDPKTLF